MDDLLFDLDFYRAQNPDLANFDDAIVRMHFFTVGLNEGRVFSPVVDLSFYAAANPDLATAGLTARRQLFDHLSNFGLRENRPFSLVFEPQTYGAANPDLVAAGLTTDDSLIAHFQQFGIDEGRFASVAFDPDFYLASNADLQAAGLNVRQAASHFQRLGIHEGRPGSVQFDASFYLASNLDLQAAGFDNRQALQHYLAGGRNENRRFTPFATAADDTLVTATNLGVVAGMRSLPEFVGASDLRDFFQFSLDRVRRVRLQVADLNPGAQATLTLFQNGGVAAIALDTFQPAITTVLPAGTYAARVEAGAGNNTGYRLALSAEIGSGSPVEPGDTIAAALDLGTLSLTPPLESFSQRGRVFAGNPVDIYRFSLAGNLTNFTISSNNVRLELIRDANGNGQIEPEEILASAEPSLFPSSPSGLLPASISGRVFRDAYFLRVTSFNDEPYEISFRGEPIGLIPDDFLGGFAEDSSVTGGGDTPEIATSLGRPLTLGIVGNFDANDYYRFALAEAQAVDINFVGSSRDFNTIPTGFAELVIFEDANGDGIAGTGEILAESMGGNLRTNLNLEAGIPYLAWVRQGEGDSADRIETSLL